ncbi:hypothetical protein BKA67DRAFT_518762 [Truncatella angustata]|uniref:Carrier domain-containing protein n=1 Tax=Truncatella angustata TaxID=152316 RepID=A0A9P8UJ54_9PEZI|nr:uncharacterized protein BKA67DRAFT_518762 [Truncatella angustata]KAH6653363.1 hypothetical protein BKA67DRAFT_518762 [Truncatella angustata]KAH8195835.1 hypothetical protein TruAng_010005 [Truncatella angustata]
MIETAIRHSPELARGPLKHETLTESPILTLDEMIRRRAYELQDSPSLCYPNQGLLDFEVHSARSIDSYADAAAQKLQALGLPAIDPSAEQLPVVGILAQSGLHFVITIIALNRLGYTAFLISTRLASPAVVQLLELTNCNTILTTPNSDKVLDEVSQTRGIKRFPMLAQSDYYGVQAPRYSRGYNAKQESSKIAVILHSSGSTGLPKPIFLSNRACIGSFAVNMDMKGLLTSPLFHSHGFYEVFRAIYSKKPLYLANYSLPLTSQNLLSILDYTKPEIFHCVPYIIKLLSESDDGIQALAKVGMVLFGGSSCPDDLGDALVKKGVNLVANYGATETGRILNSARPVGDLYWNYLRILPVARPYVVMDEIAPGLHECVALDGLPSKSTTNSNDPPRSFRTRDLFAPHPTEPGLWKYVSRLDDRFTLVNGEKVLPLPIEGRIRQEEFVKEAVVFGEGRSYPGVLVMRAARAAGISDEGYLDLVWPAVQAANAKAETFAHIPRELIVVLPANADYPQTDKGTFIRVPTYQRYENEINAAYEEYENEEGGTLKLAGADLEEFLRSKLYKQTGVELPIEADFFASGIDSLQCIQMWKTIRSELDLGGRHEELGQNILYETGTIQKLARRIQSLQEGTSISSVDELTTVLELIDKYSIFTPHRGGIGSQPSKEVILLTGVTGGLGAHLLAQLVALPNVSAVWALVRANDSAAALNRIHDALSSRGLNLDPEAQSKVVAIASDMSSANFGLDETQLASLKSSLTLAIHSAWAVNFNIPVQSFEDQHIKATHNLIQFCLSTETSNPARFFFCSSVAAAGGTPKPAVVAEGPVLQPEYALSHGYGRSKYVAEHITLNAARNFNAPARVLRIGQLVGDTSNGEWNTTEGIPLMIQTAVTLGALPELEEEMSWLPVDFAASGIIDLSGVKPKSPLRTLSDVIFDTDLVYHVINPHRFHWTRNLLPSLKQSGLDFQSLPTEEWMEKLRSSDKDPAKNPPIKLLDWFEGKYGAGARARPSGSLTHQTDATQRDSETLRNVPDVTDVKFVQLLIQKLRERWDKQ